MSAQAKPESVALVETPAVGTLPPEIQQQLELRKLSNQIAGKLAEMNWGKELDHATRRAIADWGRQFRVDVTTEIDVLGSNIYLNARFYLRQLAEMIEAGLVEYAYPDHVEDDARLAQLGVEGEGERSRRLRQRIMYQIPDAAKSAVVFRVKLRSMDREIVGVKWCGTGKKNKYDKIADPIGEDFPVETSESRSARRAMRLLTSHVPKRMSDETLAIEDGAEALAERIKTGQHEFRAREAEINKPASPISLPAAGDPYGPVATVAAPVAVPVNNSPKKDDTAPTAEVDRPLRRHVEATIAYGEGAASKQGEKSEAVDAFAARVESIMRLLSDPRIQNRRVEFTDRAATATTVEQLETIIGEIEDAMTATGELGL
jgi:hypothetical protein